MVPKIIKKHLLSSEVVKTLKPVTQKMNLSLGVMDIFPLAIRLKKDYPNFKKGMLYYVWHLVGVVQKGNETGYEKNIFYKIHDGEDVHYEMINLSDVSYCGEIKDKIVFKTVTYKLRKPKGTYPYFEEKI